MQQLLRQCMEKSAMGVSFGRIYPPGVYSDTEEMIAMAQIVAEYGGVIMARVRGKGDLLVEATDELLRVTRATGALAGKLLFGTPLDFSAQISTNYRKGSRKKRLSFFVFLHKTVIFGCFLPKNLV